MKKIFTSVASLFFLVASSFAQVDLTTGLVGNYSFSGNANDASSLANNGTVSGATATTDRFGNANSAYSFDGVNDYISLSSAKLLLPNYTYSAWVNVGSNPAVGNATSVLSIGQIAGDQSLSLQNQYSSSAANTGWGIGGYNSSTTNSSISSGTLPSTSKWIHLTSTRSASELKLYINGQLIKTTSVPGAAFYGSGTSPMANIGTRSHDNMQYFNGKIDDVKIYNRALTACEVAALANQTSSESLLASYPFNGNANDVSNNNLNGVVTGAVLTTDRFGSANSAYLFDGTNDKITIGSPFFANPTYTYSVWAYAEVLPTNNDAKAVLAIGGTSGGDQIISLVNNYVSVGNTGWSGSGYDLGGNTVSGNTVGVSPTVKTWYQLVMTRSLDTMRLYINGVQIKKSIVKGPVGYGVGATSLVIGARSDGQIQFFNGKIDDIKIYNRELAACEIKDLYTEESVVTSNLNSVLDAAVKLYPNPNDGKFVVEIPSINGSADVTIHNSIGGLVYKEVITDSKSFEFNNLPAGIYVFKLRTDGKEMTRNFVVK